ncbi:MAG: hypothetical protein FJ134_02790, partial [Deltaproteobacteria bacterium]|nr:hypothetical protein [Deltaproteobacteria bacterium]
MHILMVTPEANPFAASGGLAEVIHGLSRALVSLGQQVTVMMPLYRQVRESGRELIPTGRTLTIPLSWKTLNADLFQAAEDG